MVESAPQLNQEEPRYAYVRLAVMPNAFPGALFFNRAPPWR